MKTNLAKTASKCWLCASAKLFLKESGIALDALRPHHFAITDLHYGVTLPIYRCEDCGFLFCPDAGDVTSFYEALEDQEYENTRKPRSLQASKLLKTIRHHQPSGSLLDIGAGSGIFIEEAIKSGYQAVGIDPSSWLVGQAEQQSLPVIQGTFPDAAPHAKYDVITLIDVLEHVHTPLQLLQDIERYLSDEGIAVIVTPDVKSLAAKLLGKKWWHYRIAHISYFEKQTLHLALSKAGLEPIAWHRPAWFFPLDYLLARLGQYIPLVGKLANIKGFTSITIPLNLRDSWMVVVRRKTK